MQQQGGCHHRGSPCRLVAVSVATRVVIGGKISWGTSRNPAFRRSRWLTFQSKYCFWKEVCRLLPLSLPLCLELLPSPTNPNPSSFFLCTSSDLFMLKVHQNFLESTCDVLSVLTAHICVRVHAYEWMDMHVKRGLPSVSRVGHTQSDLVLRRGLTRTCPRHSVPLI